MKSFFDKLTGSSDMDIENDIDKLTNLEEITNNETSMLADDNSKDGELAVDVYDDGDKIIVKTMVAGVKPEDLDISITRDKVIIRGSRQTERETTKDNYHTQELYWGSFSRTIMLPTEIDIEASEATEKRGLLILTLPKVDKERKTKLKVRN
ncbi:MAG: Hsp20/alpha crystallin family protein [Patescibacteria group bacterium]